MVDALPNAVTPASLPGVQAPPGANNIVPFKKPPGSEPSISSVKPSAIQQLPELADFVKPPSPVRPFPWFPFWDNPEKPNDLPKPTYSKYPLREPIGKQPILYLVECEATRLTASYGEIFTTVGRFDVTLMGVVYPYIRVVPEVKPYEFDFYNYDLYPGVQSFEILTNRGWEVVNFFTARWDTYYVFPKILSIKPIGETTTAPPEVVPEKPPGIHPEAPDLPDNVPVPDTPPPLPGNNPDEEGDNNIVPFKRPSKNPTAPPPDPIPNEPPPEKEPVVVPPPQVPVPTAPPPPEKEEEKEEEEKPDKLPDPYIPPLPYPSPGPKPGKGDQGDNPPPDTDNPPPNTDNPPGGDTGTGTGSNPGTNPGGDTGTGNPPGGDTGTGTGTNNPPGGDTGTGTGNNNPPGGDTGTGTSPPPGGDTGTGTSPPPSAPPNASPSPPPPSPSPSPPPGLGLSNPPSTPPSLGGSNPPAPPPPELGNPPTQTPPGLDGGISTPPSSPPPSLDFDNSPPPNLDNPPMTPPNPCEGNPCANALSDKMDKKECIFWSTISVPVVECKYNAQKDEHEINKKQIQIKVIATKSSNESAKVSNLYKEIAEVKEELCLLKNKENEAYAVVPEWWQVRVFQRAQLVVQYAELKDGKLGRSRWSLSIPHYNKPKSFKPEIPRYKKGSWEGILVLKDNSKIILHASTKTECERVINTLKQFVDPKMINGIPGPKIGERKGVYKSVDVVPVRAHFFPDGQKNIAPAWSIKLWNKTDEGKK